MPHDPSHDFAAVEQFLSSYSVATPPYDFNGLLSLLLVVVDNLRAHAVEQDFADFARTVSDEQAAFLERLLEARTPDCDEPDRW